MIKNERLAKLPKEVQEEVLDTLRYFQGCYVYRHEETGEWDVSTVISLTAWHNPWSLIESFNSWEIYTNEERAKNAKEAWAGINMSDW